MLQMRVGERLVGIPVAENMWLSKGDLLF